MTHRPKDAALQAATRTPSTAATDPAETPLGMRVFQPGIDWFPATETPISDLTDRLEFTRGTWGMPARRGLFEVSGADFQTVRAAMLQE